jgi:hypothetical protein
MKKFFYCGILLFISIQLYATGPGKLRTDTVNGWQVTYNGKEILGFVMNGIKTLLMDSIADNGVITIDYYTDYPCANCAAELQFRDENGKMLATVQKLGVGDGPPFKLPGMQFRQLMHDHKLFLYYRNRVDGWSEWMFIGMVKTIK